jgi:hypothetical protein
MAFSFLYLAVRALLGALVRSRRGLDVKTSSCSCCGTSWRFCAARWCGRSSGWPTGLCWPLRRFICRDPNGSFCSCRRGRCCVGIARWCGENGGSRRAGLAGRRWRRRSGTWSSGSRARTRAGASPDLRRTAQDRLPGIADEHPPPARAGAAGAGAASRRSGLARVPEITGGQRDRLRLPHGRDDPAAPLLRALLHRVREPPRLDRRLHQEPDRRVGRAMTARSGTDGNGRLAFGLASAGGVAALALVPVAFLARSTAVSRSPAAAR